MFHDIIIVGGRCAGATLAVLLRRLGARVLLLDRDRLPSDHVISTHTIHPPGIDVLDEVGVGDEVRRVAPASRRMRLRRNHAVLDLDFAPGRAEYCPRRERLDGLLQDAAAKAGAELIDRTRVTGLVERDGRVIGVRATGPGGDQEFLADLVVGADGRHSTVAKLAGAEEYLAYDAPRGMYWSYWDAPDAWRQDPAFAFDMYIGNRDGTPRVIFQTDRDQLLIGSAPLVETCRQWRADPLAALQADLSSDPVTAPLVRRQPAEKVRGTFTERYFFRRGAGPGWVLVGDAGHHKDFLIGDGMTEALLQTRRLAAAIAEGTDLALERWWRARDVEALPLYYLGEEQGMPGPPPRLQSVVFEQAARSEDLRARMVYVMEHQRAPHETFAVAEILRWTLGAALRGHLRVLPEFLAAGRRTVGIQREIAYREGLLAAIPAATPAPVVAG
jgi:menaquinone-9 beta-reductase